MKHPDKYIGPDGADEAFFTGRISTIRGLQQENERLHKELGEAIKYGADTLQQLLNATTETEQLRVKLKELETGK